MEWHEDETTSLCLKGLAHTVARGRRSHRRGARREPEREYAQRTGSLQRKSSRDSRDECVCTASERECLYVPGLISKRRVTARVQGETSSVLSPFLRPSFRRREMDEIPPPQLFMRAFLRLVSRSSRVRLARRGREGGGRGGRGRGGGTARLLRDVHPCAVERANRVSTGVDLREKLERVSDEITFV